MSIEKKNKVQCSYCSRIIETEFTAAICSACDKKLLTIFCPGCGLEVIEGDSIRDHLRIWHKTCYSTMGCTDSKHDDFVEDSALIGHETTKKRVIHATGTYIYHDSPKEENKQEFTRIRKDSLSYQLYTEELYAEEGDLNMEEMNDPATLPIDPLAVSQKNYPSELRSIVYRMQSMGIVKDNEIDGFVYKNSIIGLEIVTFLLSRRLSSNREEALQIGQDMLNQGILLPVVDDVENSQEYNQNTLFEGDTELYYFNTTLLEESVDVGLTMATPKNNVQKEHSKFVTMSGYLISINSTGIMNRLFYDLSSGILRSHATVDGAVIEAFDTHEFTVQAVTKEGDGRKSTFKLVGAVRELQFQTDTLEEFNEWMKALKGKN